MEKRKLNRITAGFIVLVVMVLILMFSNSLRRSSHITLPEEGSSPGQTEDDTNASGGDALTVIAVTPETVQTAIETLTRPRQYSRVIRVEQLVPLRPPSRSAAAGHGQIAPCRTDRFATPSPTGRSLISGMAVRAAFTAPLRGTSPRMTSKPSPPMRPSWTCRWRISPPRITAASPM